MAETKTPSQLAKEEEAEARDTLRKLKKFSLKRDVFFVHGWGDEANVCWTYPYTETGEDKSPGWEYTIKDWIDKLVENKEEKVHYLKLLRDESKAKINIDKKSKISIDIDKDETYYYKNFFQFAELLKDKINSQKTTEQVDIVCHSMGGLDSVAAIAVDKEIDSTKTIKSPYLKGINLLITVSTPHQGSPAAKLSDSKLAEILLRKSTYIRTQGSNMQITSSFMKLVNSLDVRNQLLERVSFMHMFGGGADIVVPLSSYKVKTQGLKKNNYEIHPALHLARHSQVRGITQNHKLHFEIIKLLAN